MIQLGKLMQAAKEWAKDTDAIYRDLSEYQMTLQDFDYDLAYVGGVRSKADLYNIDIDHSNWTNIRYEFESFYRGILDILGDEYISGQADRWANSLLAKLEAKHSQIPDDLHSVLDI